jgi:triosephosphate isomerase
MLCVGELLVEREAGTTKEVVLRQLDAGLKELDDDAIALIAIAYEPVWAIGTGKTATPDDAAAVHTEIRKALAERLGDRARDIPILYGGSVNATNAKALLAAANVDGLLVGGASLDSVVWASICEA